ncbi:MAG: dihydrofolate reductase [Zymomonas mobilis]|uniref:Dihydrofolate reductase n=1 Tax=Zymomonas mobilis TaxID=542 RepID=A0A542VZV2_ZYMMB|nr:dihydrofolate reductase [Zymomonas mobilis]TQL16827.1 dihydrofolate reductase [Zymomonas mobilis]
MPHSPEITIILARAQNGVIGIKNSMPWHIPADLKHFKALTVGHPMIMGRRTFESLPGLLPKRPHIVLTHKPDWQAEGAEVAHDLTEAIKLARQYSDKIAVIGGAHIFKQFWDSADCIELTEIYRDYDGDTVVDLPDMTAFSLTAQEEFEAENERPAFSFKTFRKK